MDRKGRFIALEGLDGSGTTTQAVALAEVLRGREHRVVVTHEPSNGLIGRMVREQLGARDARLDPHALALLFAADRLHHVRTEIEPALAGGAVVVCDRYVISSWVYQGLDCDLGWIETINAHAPWPDATFLLEVPVEIALQRVGDRGAAREIFETEQLQRRVARGYAAVLERGLAGVHAIDGRASPTAVTDALLQRCIALGL